MVLSSLVFFFFFLLILRPPRSTLFPYTTLFRSLRSQLLQYLSTSVTDTIRCLSGVRGARRGATQGRLYCSRCCARAMRSEEHTSELQSHSDLVCRLLLEKKKKKEK